MLPTGLDLTKVKTHLFFCETTIRDVNTNSSSFSLSHALSVAILNSSNTFPFISLVTPTSFDQIPSHFSASLSNVVYGPQGSFYLLSLVGLLRLTFINFIHFLPKFQLQTFR